MNNKLLYIGVLLVSTVACQPSKTKKNTTLQEITKTDTLNGFYYDSITGKKYVTVDTINYILVDSLLGKSYE